MNRMNEFDFIEERLNTLAVRVEKRSQLNLQDLNTHSENFFAALFNIIFDFDLENVNTTNHNIASIDLKDVKQKIIVQVSATATKTKIENTLTKSILNTFHSYRLYFIFIGTKDCQSLRNRKYLNPCKIAFEPEKDIYDLKRILSIIQNLNVNKIQKIKELIKKEIGFHPDDIQQYNSAIATIVNILSEEPLSEEEPPNTLDFQIEEKIKFNLLDAKRDFIRENDIYLGNLNKVYKEYTKVGKNTCIAILNSLRTEYRKVKEQNKNALDIFDKLIVIEKEKVKQSKNAIELPDEMTELCVQIIIVDAFMKCKIFENPKGYKYATTR